MSGVLLVLLAAQLYYSYVMSGIWNEERLAIQASKQHGDLVTTAKTYKSVWGEDNKYWVISGTDQNQEEIMVWVKFTEEDLPVPGEDAVAQVKMSSGKSEAQIRDQIHQELPGATIKRLLPGMYEGDYAWQLHYGHNGQLGYRFYRFEDGNAIGDDIILPHS
ncbi:hypothetical protein JCM10914_767 [Paenibacillus sp. JCM 10914]|nr:hypothetical protein JCM10914_767 [Paenibacillus sp. JCM 10914]